MLAFLYTKDYTNGLELDQKDAEQFMEMLSGEKRYMDTMCLFHASNHGQIAHLEDPEEFIIDILL